MIDSHKWICVLLATAATACSSSHGEASPSSHPSQQDAGADPDAGTSGIQPVYGDVVASLEDPFDPRLPENCDSLPRGPADAGAFDGSAFALSAPVVACFQRDFWMTLTERKKIDHRAFFDDMVAYEKTLPFEPFPEAALLNELISETAVLLLTEDGDPSVLSAIEQYGARADQESNGSRVGARVFHLTGQLMVPILTNDVAALKALEEEVFSFVTANPDRTTLDPVLVGAAASTGIPARFDDVLAARVCNAPWCEHPTWAVPRTLAGHHYLAAESFARMGRVQDAQTHLDAAMKAPDFAGWTAAPGVIAAAKDVPAWAAPFAPTNPDTPPFLALPLPGKSCGTCHGQ